LFPMFRGADAPSLEGQGRCQSIWLKIFSRVVTAMLGG
jgi:hypothetical protein